MHVRGRQAAVSRYSAVLMRATHDRHAQAARRQGRRERRAMGARRGQGARDRRPRLQARDRPAGADRPHARSVRPLRRHALRAGGAGAERARPARRSPRSRRCSPPRASSWPSSRWTTGRCSGGATGRGTIGGALAANLSRPAPDQGRRRARPFPRLLGGVRARRDLQVGRPGGEERHRLRSLQADGGLLGHARGADRGDDQDAAAARDRGDRGDVRARRRDARCAPWRPPWGRPATSRAPPICRPRRRRGFAMGRRWRPAAP